MYVCILFLSKCVFVLQCEKEKLPAARCIHGAVGWFGYLQIGYRQKTEQLDLHSEFGEHHHGVTEIFFVTQNWCWYLHHSFLLCQSINKEVMFPKETLH